MQNNYPRSILKDIVKEQREEEYFEKQETVKQEWKNKNK